MTALLIDLALGFLAGAMIGAAYLFALRRSLAGLADASGLRLALSSILRLAVIALLVAGAVKLGAGATHLAAALLGFMLVRHLVMSRLLKAEGGRP